MENMKFKIDIFYLFIVLYFRLYNHYAPIVMDDCLF
jgi:hypothetical protein